MVIYGQSEGSSAKVHHSILEEVRRFSAAVAGIKSVIDHKVEAILKVQRLVLADVKSRLEQLALTANHRKVR